MSYTRHWRDQDLPGGSAIKTIASVLDTFGLTEDQESLYEYMLTRSPMRQVEIAEATTNEGWALEVGATLRQLQGLGLVARIPSDPPTWTVVAPDTALDALLLGREQVLAAARHRITELVARFRGGSWHDPMELVEVVYGKETVLGQFERLQREAKVEVCAADAPPYATVLPPESHPINTLELEMLARGVSYRVLYHPRGLDRPGRLTDLQVGIAAGEQARVAEVPVKLFMSDRSRALLPLNSKPTEFASALRVEESTLVDALQELFETYWERAIPLQVQDGEPPFNGSTRPTDAERSLLPLLVGGLSDVAIARQLGWAERTVRRHIRAMMVKLKAGTRFQAGYQAVLQGWLGDGEGSDGRTTP